MFLDEILKEKYDDVFNKVYTDLKNQLKTDPNFTIKNIESLLESLYAVEGNDWLGRGELQDVITAARIAACETILGEMKKGK